MTRAAIERFLQALVDLAVDINAHLAVSQLDEAPVTSRASFVAAAKVGAIDESLAHSLTPAAGLRNVLVHGYVEIDVAKVAAAVPEMQRLFAEYVNQIAKYLLDHEPS